MKLIAGSSNLPLAEKISHQLNLPLLDVDFDKFANGEKRVWIKESVAGEDVVIVQSLSFPTDEYIIELLLIIDALERAGAKEVHVIIPWMGYSLQDKVFRPGEPIAAKVVADLISHSYVKRAYLLDLHSTSIPGFFSIPTIHLSALQLFADYAQKEVVDDHTLVASPDFGGLKRAEAFADLLHLDLVNIDKDRNRATGEITSAILHGNVTDKTVLLFDDVVQSGGTAFQDAATLRQAGAKKIILFVSHGPMVDQAYQKIQESNIDQLVVTNSIDHHHQSEKMVILDISPLFVAALQEWF